MATSSRNKVISISMKLKDEFSPVLTKAFGALKGFTAGVSKGVIGILLSPVRLLTGAIKALLSPLTSVIGLIGTFLAGRALIRMAMETVNTVDELDKLNARFGIGVETLGAFRLAAELTGGSLDSVARALKALSKNANDFSQGMGEAADTFRALGIEVIDPVTGKMRGVEDLLLDVADGFSRMNDETREAAFAQEIFGRAGTDLLPLLRLGREEIARLTQEARDLGGVLSREQVTIFVQLKDAATKVKFALFGLRARIMEVIGPDVTQALERLALKIASFGKFLANVFAGVRAAFSDLEVAKDAAFAIDMIGNSLISMLEIIGETAILRMGGAIVAAIRAIAGPIAKAITGHIGGAIAEGLGFIVSRFEASMAIVGTMLGLPKEMMKDLVEQAKFAEQFWQDIGDTWRVSASDVMQEMRDNFKETWNEFNQIASDTTDRLQPHFEFMKQGFEALGIAGEQWLEVMRRTFEESAPPPPNQQSVSQWTAFWKGFQNGAKEAWARVSNIFAAGQEAFASLMGAFNSGVDRAVDGIIDGTQTISEAFREMAKDILKSIAKILAQQAALALVSNLFPGAAKLNLSIPGVTQDSAHGNIFRNAGIVPFARGGIVDRPELFALRNGIGLRGESGPEAILPLKRNSRGDLGVIARGGGAQPVSVTVNINTIDSRSFDQRLIEHKRTIRDAVADGMQRSRNFRQQTRA